MKQLRLISILVLSITFSYGQKENQNTSQVVARPPNPCGTVSQNPCNYVSNGDFETHNGFSNSSNFNDVACLWNTIPAVSGADYFHVSSTNSIYGIPYNSGSGTPNATNTLGTGSGDGYIGFSIFHDDMGYNNESVLTQLNLILLPNTTYTLSFHALKRFPFNNDDSPEIQACFINSLAFPTSNMDVEGNLIIPSGSIFLDEDITIESNNQWEEVEFTFTTGNTAGQNFLYIGGLVDPTINDNEIFSGAYIFIDNVVLTPVFNPVLDLPQSICITETNFNLNTYLTGGTTGGYFEVDGVAITGSSLNASSYITGNHTISYVIPDTIACSETVVSDIAFFSNCIPNAPYISQVYVGAKKNKAIEVKNKSNTNTVTSGTYYLVWYEGSVLPANLSTPAGYVDLASTSTIAPNGVKVFKTTGFAAPTYVNSLVTDVLNIDGFDGLYDVVIISTSYGAHAYDDRIDTLGDNSPVYSMFYKQHTMEEYRSLVRVSCMPTERQAPQVYYDEQDWVGFNRFGTNDTGFFDESAEITNQFSKTNGVLGRHYSDEVRWIGTWDDIGITNSADESNPDRSRSVVINALYDTSISGNFEACSLVSNIALNIEATNYVKVQTKVTSTPASNGILIQDDGSLIQVRDRFYDLENQELISVNGNNSLKHSRTTNGVNHQYDYVFWSSPLSANTNNLPIHSFFPLGNTTGMFDPGRFFIFENANFNDSNGDLYDDHAYTDPYDSSLVDYVPFSIIPNFTSLKFIPGRGYNTWPAVGNTSDYMIEFKGEMNNGEVFVPIYNNNSSTGQNPNLVGNPYPSAIDLDVLFNVNLDVIEPLALIWGRAVSDPEVIYPGPDAYNYSEDNYLIYNPTMIIDSTFDSNATFNSEGILASCQSFFVRAKGGINYVGAGNYLGDLKFSNVMRSTRPNTTFARLSNNKNNVTNSSSSNEGKLWLNLTDNEGYIVQQGIAFLENKNDEFVEGEDIRVVNGRKYNFYSKISNEDVVINLQSAFDETKVIPLEITNISKNVEQKFTISIPKKEGVFNEQEVYLYDAMLQVTHNLSKTPYLLTTTEMVTEGRFYLQFTNSSSNLVKQSDEEVVVFSKDGRINILSKYHNVIEVNVVDLYNVKDGVKSVASIKQQNTKSLQLEVNDLSKLIEVTITLENGTVIHKKIYK